MEAAEAKDLIDEAIERAETQFEHDVDAERAAERSFRDRVSVLIGVLAVCLAIVHLGAAAAARESLLRGIEASDTFGYMQAKIIRETVLKAAAGEGGAPADRATWAAEARRLRAPDRAGHGIGQLQEKGDELRREGEASGARGEWYELGETALQMAIVLLSIALVARSRPIVFGASGLALVGVGVAVAARLGLLATGAG